MPSNHLILCRPLLHMPSIFPSIRVFSNESALCIRWPTYWSFSFNISPSNEYSGVSSFKMNWLDLLRVQGTLKSLLQHHSSKASIFRHSAFSIVQLSYPYVTTGKSKALSRRTFVGKVISLFFLTSDPTCPYPQGHGHHLCLHSVWQPVCAVSLLGCNTTVAILHDCPQPVPRKASLPLACPGGSEFTPACGVVLDCEWCPRHLSQASCFGE